MNASNLYTRTRLGLDNRVWMVLMITVLISAALFGFKMATHQPCRTIEMVISNNDKQIEGKFFPQDRISFEANMTGAKDIVWDFGDGTPTATGKTIIHAYANPGSYFVTTIINGKCKEFIPIVISTRILPTVSSGANMPAEDIVGPEAPKAGVPATYTTSLNSSTYEWNILNSPEYPTQKTPVVNFTFNTPGAKTLELKLDGGKVYRKTIQVLPGDAMPQQPIDNSVPDIGALQPQQQEEPTPEQPAAPKSTFVADEVFKQMFEDVVKGNKDASSFAQFLCNGSQTKVRDNGESWTTVGEFCSKIHDKKKYDIKSVVSVRDPNDKCVLQLQIKYKKKGFLGL